MKTTNSPTLTAQNALEDIGPCIQRARTGQLPKQFLVDLLSERHAVYDNRPSYQMTRIRGYALASFLEVGLPPAALHVALDELQNGRDAYLVGAAARALRGAAAPKAQYTHFLLQAINNLRYHDDSMSFEAFQPDWPLEHPTTGRREAFLTLEWLQGYAKAALPELHAFVQEEYLFCAADKVLIERVIATIEADERILDLSCCDLPVREKHQFSWWHGMKNIKHIGQLPVENQAGLEQPLEQYTQGRPTVVSFFYTRCMNPNKCTLTINKLAELQQQLVQQGLAEEVNLLAFTYDPSYDHAIRLYNFGNNRGLKFNERVQLLRTRPEDFEHLSNFFELGVNHVSSAVNQHRLELYVLDQHGTLRTSYTRLQWDLEQVMEQVKRLLKPAGYRGWRSSVGHALGQIVFPILLAFFPKCPICWGVYLSAFGISGLNSIPYSPWLVPVLMGAMGINLFILYRSAKRRNGLVPFGMSLLGSVLVIGPGYVLSYQMVSFVGIAFILLGALFNSLSYWQWSKLRHLWYTVTGYFTPRLVASDKASHSSGHSASL